MTSRIVMIFTVMCLLMGAPPLARGDFVLRATFHERHVFPGEDLYVDINTDDWSLEIISGECPWGISVDQVQITLPSSPVTVYYDTVAGGSGFDVAGPFSGGSMTGISSASASAVADGGQVLTLDFTGFDAVGDRYEYEIDVDNSTAGVRGYHAGPHGAIGGNSTPTATGDLSRSAELRVSYTSGGVELVTSGHFVGYPDTDPFPHNNAYCDVKLTCIPTPSALLLCLIGVGTVLGYRRLRRL